MFTLVPNTRLRGTYIIIRPQIAVPHLLTPLTPLNPSGVLRAGLQPPPALSLLSFMEFLLLVLFA